MKKIINVTKLQKKLTPKLLQDIMKDKWVEYDGDMPEILLMTKKQRNDFDKYISKIPKKITKSYKKHPTSFCTLILKIKK